MTPIIPCCDQARGVACCGRRRRDQLDDPGQRAVQAAYDKDGRPYYGTNGPNRSYQQGPNTRVYITSRSWLDAGTEVLPGDRKFQDYAFPPALGYPSFARENLNRRSTASRSTRRRIWADIRRFPLY